MGRDGPAPRLTKRLAGEAGRLGVASDVEHAFGGERTEPWPRPEDRVLMVQSYTRSRRRPELSRRSLLAERV